jgi:hypothetical protein
MASNKSRTNHPEANGVAAANAVAGTAVEASANGTKQI